MKRVIIIATGGTIAMKKNGLGESLPAVSGRELLQSVPDLENIAACEVVEFSNVASCNMDPQTLVKLSAVVQQCLADSGIAGIVITHGTDTLEETAFFLELTIEDKRPIILTAAQRDASEADSDGPRNIKNAVRVAADPDAMDRGVMVLLNEEIHCARHVTKAHTSSVAAFYSGPFGLLGYCDVDRINWYHPHKAGRFFALPERVPKVIPLLVFTGMESSILRHLMTQGTEGFVLEAFGRGNMPPELENGIEWASQKGIPIVVSSRSPYGRVLPIYAYTGGGARLKKLGCIFSEGLSTAKSRLLLMLALSVTQDFAEIQAIFSQEGSF
ncbi:MAG: asparaginase [Desulfitobacteriaceae bacterium]